MKQFYSYLIEIETIIVELDRMDLTKEQRTHLAQLIDSSIHHTILDTILSELSDADKRVFLQHLSAGSHDQIWKFLNEKVDNIEGKIKKAADDLKDQLHKDLKEATKKK